MKTLSCEISLLALILLLSGALFGQNDQASFSRFQAGLVLGANFSQIDGDNLAGFNKFGFQAGPVVHAFLDDRKRYSLSMEILFNQKGSRNTGNGDKATLNYAEVPIQFNYHDKDRLIFGGGLAFGSIVGYKDGGITIEVDEGKRELSYLFTATFLASPNWGIGLRYGGSITSFGTSVNPLTNGLINRMITLRAAYYL